MESSSNWQANLGAIAEVKPHAVIGSHWTTCPKPSSLYLRSTHTDSNALAKCARQLRSKPMLRATCNKHVTLALRRNPVAHTLRPNNIRYSSSGKPTKLVEQIQASKTPPQANVRYQALPWVFAVCLAGALGVYSGALYVAARKPCTNPAIADISQQKDVFGRYEDTADSFDSEVGISESLMGINRMRKKLAKRCTGHVLEVSCGTGRNIGYYDVGKEAAIESVTFVDISPQMLEICRKKWDILVESQKRSDRLWGNKSFKPHLIVRFLTASALESMPPPPSRKKYDTIIQTMGLCSTPAPRQLLLSMMKHLDTSNPEARILLLEHGRSYRG